jgi:hypothetical protein
MSNKDMLQLIEATRILIARMIRSEWNTRYYGTACSSKKAFSSAIELKR